MYAHYKFHFTLYLNNITMMSFCVFLFYIQLYFISEQVVRRSPKFRKL